MTNKQDYRNACTCISLKDTAIKKQTLEQKIRNNHKRVRIIYNRVKEKNNPYFKEFSEIYNKKCAYCGASLLFTDIRLFEIDHYICESAFSDDTNGRIEAGKIDNLVFSCYSCNRGKGSLHIAEDKRALLNPDDNSISKVFVRNHDYQIIIRDDYLSDNIVEEFYNSLMLGSEARRLDFLLLEMNALIHNLKEKNQYLANKLEVCLSRLMKKRNFSVSSEQD